MLGLAPELRFHDVQASVPLRHPTEGSWFTVQGFRFRGTCRDPKIVSPLAPALEIPTTSPLKTRASRFLSGALLPILV